MGHEDVLSGEISFPDVGQVMNSLKVVPHAIHEARATPRTHRAVGVHHLAVQPHVLLMILLGVSDHTAEPKGNTKIQNQATTR